MLERGARTYRGAARAGRGVPQPHRAAAGAPIWSVHVDGWVEALAWRGDALALAVRRHVAVLHLVAPAPIGSGMRSHPGRDRR